MEFLRAEEPLSTFELSLWTSLIPADPLKHIGNYMYQLKNGAFCPHGTFMYFIWFSGHRCRMVISLEALTDLAFQWRCGMFCERYELDFKIKFRRTLCFKGLSSAYFDNHNKYEYKYRGVEIIVSRTTVACSSACTSEIRNAFQHAGVLCCVTCDGNQQYVTGINFCNRIFSSCDDLVCLLTMEL
jgi:hypothetical protein